MSRKMMVLLLRLSVLFCAVVCVLVLCVLLPRAGERLAQQAEGARLLLLLRRLSGAAVTLLLLCACVPAWQVIGTLREKRQAFCRGNTRRLRLAACFLWVSALLLVLTEAVLAMLGGALPVFSTLVVPCAALCLLIAGLVCFVLGRLVEESAEIREENDLTV